MSGSGENLDKKYPLRKHVPEASRGFYEWLEGARAVPEFDLCDCGLYDEPHRRIYPVGFDLAEAISVLLCDERDPAYARAMEKVAHAIGSIDPPRLERVEKVRGRMRFWR